VETYCPEADRERDAAKTQGRGVPNNETLGTGAAFRVEAHGGKNPDLKFEGEKNSDRGERTSREIGRGVSRIREKRFGKGKEGGL